LKILHLVKATGIAGAETHLLVLMSGLVKQGMEVSLIVLEDPTRRVPGLLETARGMGVEALAVPIYAHLDPGLPSRLTRTFRPRPFDILHAHLPHAEVYGARVLGGLPQAGFVITRHSDNPFRRSPLFRLVFTPSWKRAGKIIAISEAVRRSMIRSEHVPSERIAVIPYGLDSQEFHAGLVPGRLKSGLGIPDAPLVGFVGRLVRPKGVDTLLRAFVEVERREPRAQLVIVGDGPWRQRLVHLGRDLGLSTVHFLGWREDVVSIMADLDVLVMPSRWEGFGLVALEAMSLGKPVIATRVSALPEVIAEGVTGLLVPAEDPSSLAREILKLLRDPILATRMGQAGSQRVRREFTVDRMVSSTIQVYHQILGANP
jgi:glycosyltransferase involved in cell wall biosynthesis